MAAQDAADEGTYGLDKVLEALSRDLRTARDAAKGDNVGLVIREAEVELAFTVEKKRDGSGGVNLKVFGVGVAAGGGKGSSEESVQRIKLKLTGTGDDPFAVAGR